MTSIRCLKFNYSFRKILLRNKAMDRKPPEPRKIIDPPVAHTHFKPELILPIGHTEGINSACFSPDGCYALSGSDDATLKLWDVKSGQEIRTFQGHTDAVMSVCISPDGCYALSGSEDHTIKLWDIQTGQEIQFFKVQNNLLSSVCFSPDGLQALSTDWDGSMILWDIQTGKEVCTFERQRYRFPFTCVCFSPDNRHILSGSFDGILKLWDIQTREIIETFEGHTSRVSSVCFSPDGRNTLSGSEDHTIKLWDIQTGQETRCFQGHTDFVQSICFSPDSRHALSGSHDGTLRLWDIQTGQETRCFQGHTVSIRPTTSRFFVGDIVMSVCISPDGRYALSGSQDGTLRLWDIQSGKEIRSFGGHSDIVYSVCFSTHGQQALSGLRNGTLKLWDILTGLVIGSFKGHSDSIESVCISPDGRQALSGSSDHTMKLWDIQTGQETRCFQGHTDTVESVCFSPDGQYALSGADKTLKLWDIQTGQEIRSFEGHKSFVSSVIFSPDGRQALSGSVDGTLKLWDIQTGQEIRSFEGHKSFVNSVDFSPDGRQALSGSRDRTLKLWDIQTGQEIRSFEGHSFVHSICFSPDGRNALSGGNDCTIRLWDVQTGQELRSFKGHTSSVHSICFSPDGRNALSGGYDCTIRLWDILEGTEIASMISLDSDEWIITSPSGLFDASEGAMAMIHYTVGLETIGFDQLIGRYHIPGLFSVLMDSKEDLPIVPPIENIRLHPTLDARLENDMLILGLENRGGGIGKVLVYVEDIEFIADARTIPAKDSMQERLNIRIDLRTFIRFFIPGELNELTIFCENVDGTLRSKPIKLSYAPESLTSKGVSATKNDIRGQETDRLDPVRLHGIFIGSNTRGLEFADSDAEEMAKIVESAGKNLYGDQIKVSVYSGGNLIKNKVLEEFNVMAQKLTYQDIVVIFLSGHATTKGEFQEYYFILKDNRMAESIEQIIDTPEMRDQCTLSLTEIRRLVNEIPARKKILILDTCSSGHVAGHFGAIKSARTESYSQVKIINEIRRSTGFCILASCSENKESYEFKSGRHGLMTYSILNGISTGEGLLKKSDNKEYIEPVTLFNFVKAKTEKLADDSKMSQVPNIHMPKSLDLLIGEVTAEDKKSIKLTGLPLFTWSSINPVEYDHYLGLDKQTDLVLKEFARHGILEFSDRIDQPDVLQILGSYRIESGNMVIQCWLNKGGQRMEASKYQVIRPVTEIEKAALQIVQMLKKFGSNTG